MQRIQRLTASEREFLARLSEFVFSNSYDEPRVDLLRGLMPDHSAPMRPEDHRRLSEVVTRRLTRLDAAGPATVDQFPPEDRPLVEIGFLYPTYHRYLEDLDRLIERQLRSEAPLEVSFARDLYTDLAQRGFGEGATGRYFGFFFQLRRAFYFIERSLPGQSPSMRRLRRDLWNSTFTHDMRSFGQQLWNRMEDFSTLLLGETGTGKGSAASAIGRSSFIPFAPTRRTFVENFATSFIALNLSQFPETLIESELFGHRKGSFTGAINDYAGVFARCSEHGGLFLDEIGEIGVPIQIKLLQVLQERTFTSLGSHEVKRFKGRVIAATNQSLDQLRSQGRFRADLFYRLCSDIIVVPPLRVRLEEAPGELEELVAVLVARMTGEPNAALSDRLLSALRRDLPAGYPWPGNVRELEQAVRRIVLTGTYRGDRRETDRPASPDDAFLDAIRSGALTADELVAGYCALLHRRHPTYVEVAERTGLDRRTVRKHLAPAGRPRPLTR